MSDQDWHEEAESHLSMREEWLRERGADAQQARRVALKAFGNRGQLDEEVRAVRIPAWFDEVRQDLNYAWRGLRKSPAFSLAAIATVALGIGASTAVFSFTDRILFRPLPYLNEDRLVWFGMTAPISSGMVFLLNYDFVMMRKEQQVFTALTATPGTRGCDLVTGDAVALRCAGVTPQFLSTLGLRPMLGRDFTADEERHGGPSAALISHALWLNRFGGRADIEGQMLDLEGKAVRVAGVLPPEFELPMLSPVDILTPLQLDENLSPKDPATFLQAFGRLRAGITPAEAAMRLQPLYQRALQSAPPRFLKEISFELTTLRERQVRDSRRAALFLLGAVVLVLLISIANVANLLSARAASREREMAVRAAMGAGKGRLARQAVTESLLLSLLGGIAGIALAAMLLKLVSQVSPAGIARLGQASIDWRVIGAALAASAVAGVLFGLAPAMQRTPLEALTGGRVIGRRRQWLRPTLVVAQIGLSLILLCGAGLLLQSLWKLTSVDIGMRIDSLVSVQAQLPALRYPARAQRLAFWEQVEQRLSRLPGIGALAISDSLPPLGRMNTLIYNNLQIDGRPRAEAGGTGGMIGIRTVTPTYFSVLGVPLRKGRLFTEEDRKAAEQTVVLSDSLARRLFPHGENPVGRRLTHFGTHWTVIGVVADVRNAGLVVMPDPEMYIVRHENGHSIASNFAVMRMPTALIPAVREEFRQLDPRLTLRFETLEERVGKLSEGPRFQTLLIGGFALAGLMLAAVGLYGVIALLVTQRTAEIGIRMALGATARDVRRMVTGQAGRWLLAGVALGLAGAAASAKLIDGLLFQTQAADPVVLSAAVATLMLTGWAAAWLPARRAACIEPVRALRKD